MSQNKCCIDAAQKFEILIKDADRKGNKFVSKISVCKECYFEYLLNDRVLHDDEVKSWRHDE